MFRAIRYILGTLVILVVGVVAVGYMLPQSHVASRSTVLAQPPDRVYAVLTDVESYPKWRSEVSSVEVVSSGPPKRWREHGSNGDITFEFSETAPPARLVSRIADTNLAFGGSWTYELAPEGTGTRLTITERGEVYNPVFRFMSRFVFGHTATIEQFLTALERHLG